MARVKMADSKSMDSIRRALAFVLRESGVSARALARYLDISDTTLSHVRHGRTLSAVYAERTARKLHTLISTACAENGIRIGKGGIR